MSSTKTFDKELKEFFSIERWEKEASKSIKHAPEKYPPEHIEFLIDKYKSKFPSHDRETKTTSHD